MLIDVEFDTDLDETVLVQFDVTGTPESLMFEFKSGFCIVFDAGSRCSPIHTAKMKAVDLVEWGYYEHAENLARVKWQELAGGLFR
jgi:hypothetical protein